ncbi:MAG: protein-disulfide reductase DsbD family protein [Acidobacteria bacterium]|nr:protein-disulfide reductase DsbD family protein [Acidobacteriota bacterium]
MGVLLRMRGSTTVGAVAVAVWCACATVAAQPAPARTGEGPHVRVELITDRATVSAGSLGMALRFTLDPEWHLYWQNPGDSGGPPEAEWQVPRGVRVGLIEWPLPRRIEDAGLVNYGYMDMVVLPVQVAVAAGLPRGPMSVTTSVRWIVCRSLCVSGKASLALTWPLPESERAAVPAWSQAIAEARRRVPRAAPAGWTADATAGTDSFILTVVTGQRETGGVFYPLDPGQIDDTAPQAVTPVSMGLRMHVRKAAQLVKVPAALRGIIAFPDGRACEITATVSRTPSR